MSSLKQIEANRRNALHSTGPTTPEGVERSRRNALRHGLTAETVVAALEDSEDYQAFEAAVISDYDAESAVERELVLRLASVLWRLRRATGIETASFQTARRILDFGCGDGRIIRWLHDLKDCEVWGVDLVGEYILLCQQYLSPPFKFATNTSELHLPFEDRSFDLIYACSVFTHIADLADAWLLELRRILRPEGRLFITVHDDRSIEMCLDPETVRRLPYLAWLRDMLSGVERQISFVGTNYSMFTAFRAPGPGGYREAQVFYKTDYLKQHLASMFNVRSITLEAYSEYQSGYLLEKPAS